MPTKTPQSESQKVPKLRFAGFEGGWEEKKLGDILSIDRGASPRPIDKYVTQSEDGIAWIKIGDIAEGLKYIEKTKEKITKEGAKASRSVTVGDFILSNSMSFGRPYILKIDGCVHDGWLVLKNRNRINLSDDFLYEVLSSEQVRKKFLSLAAGSAVKNLKSESVKMAKISLPLLPEQQKVAEFLGGVDEWIENLRAQKESLGSYKKGMMQKIFSQQIRFKDDKGNEFPKWEEKKLGEVCDKRSSSVSANSLGDNEGEYKIYGASGLLKKVDFYKEKEAYVSIVKDGAGVGRILLCDPMTSVLGTLDIIKPKDSVNLYFLYLLLSRINFVEYTTGATIPHIYFKDYKKEKLTIPSFPEQQKIAEFLASVDKVLESKQQQITQAEQWKRGLMQGLFV